MRRPIVDAHMHLDPEGRGADAVREFVRYGGTHLFLVNKPYRGITIKGTDDLKKEYETTLKMAEYARKAGAIVNVILGPHPVHYVHLVDRMDRNRALEIMMKGMEIAGEYLGDRATGLGEIGLPHFTVPEWIMEDSKEILLHGMEVAAENDAPVVIHGPTAPWFYDLLVELADDAGLKRERIIRHYSPPDTDIAGTKGIFLSILASRENIADALEKGDRFMLETDYMDDPRRPGAVLGLKNVPKITKKMLLSGELSEDLATLIHVKNPEKAFGVDIEI